MKAKARKASDLSENCDLGAVVELRWEPQAVVVRISLGSADIRSILRHLKHVAPKKLKTQKLLQAVDELDGCLAGSRVYIVGDSILTPPDGVMLKRIRSDR